MRSISSACRFPSRDGCSTPTLPEHAANNFLDHSNIGESSIYYPVTVEGALVQAWELTLRSPHLWRYGQGISRIQTRLPSSGGTITGGLICFPIGSPDCDVVPGTRRSTMISATR